MMDKYYVITTGGTADRAEAVADLATMCVPDEHATFKARTGKDIVQSLVPGIADHLINTKTLRDLENCMGHLQNGSQTKVTLWQDDATPHRSERVGMTVGETSYVGYSLADCIRKAVAAGEDQND